MYPNVSIVIMEGVSMTIKILLVDFSKSVNKIEIPYRKGDITVEEWGKLYEKLLDNYEKKIINLVHKGEV